MLAFGVLFASALSTTVWRVIRDIRESREKAAAEKAATDSEAAGAKPTAPAGGSHDGEESSGRSGAP
jgi:hypothetical protein